MSLICKFKSVGEPSSGPNGKMELIFFSFSNFLHLATPYTSTKQIFFIQLKIYRLHLSHIISYVLRTHNLVHKPNGTQNDKEFKEMMQDKTENIAFSFARLTPTSNENSSFFLMRCDKPKSTQSKLRTTWEINFYESDLFDYIIQCRRRELCTYNKIVD
jgi:cyclophilin family peptidyl-prolyl cis-trans isomerase